MKVRDLHHKEKFFVDDHFLRGYAAFCGWQATLAYICLCRHANRNQECFPSVELMKEEMRVSRDTIMRGIKKLREVNIITVQRKRRKNGRWPANTYVLLDKSEWKKIQVADGDLVTLTTDSKTASQVAHSDVDYRVAHSESPSRPKRKVRVADSETKDTHLKDTQDKVMLRFEEFWEAYPKKKSKGYARKAWLKINPDDELFKKILEALSRAKRSDDWMKDAGQFIPYPATWLNAEGWEDEHGRITAATCKKDDDLAKYENWKREAVPMPEDCRRDLGFLNKKHGTSFLNHSSVSGNGN